MADDAAAPEGEPDRDVRRRVETVPDEATESPDPDSDTEEPLRGSDATDVVVEPKRRRPMSLVKPATILGLVTVLALRTGGLGRLARLSVASGRAAARALPPGRQAGGAQSDHHRLFEHADADVKRSIPGRPPIRSTTTSPSACSRSSMWSSRRSRNRLVRCCRGSGVRERRQRPGAGRGDGQDVQRRCAEQAPRAWRMRISVRKVGEEAKVSNVEFVP